MNISLSLSGKAYSKVRVAPGIGKLEVSLKAVCTDVDASFMGLQAVGREAVFWPGCDVPEERDAHLIWLHEVWEVWDDFTIRGKMTWSFWGKPIERDARRQLDIVVRLSLLNLGLD